MNTPPSDGTPTPTPAPASPQPMQPIAPSHAATGKYLVWLFTALVIVGAASWWFLAPKSPKAQPQTEAPIRIGFSLGTLREERWQRDIDLFTARAEALGATVIPAYANDDSKLQITQAEDLILQKVDVLVVVAQDGDAAAQIVQEAHAAGIKVVAYDRLINDPTLDLFVTFDSRIVGKLEAQEMVRRVPKGIYAYIGGSTTDNNAFLHKEGAMGVLQPLIDKGDITLAVNSFTDGWKPDIAYKTMSAYLATGKKVDAVVAANDGTAGGVVQALTEHGLAGKVPVTGQDADLAACQRIVAGTQVATVYKPISVEAGQAAEDAVALARGGTVDAGGTIPVASASVPARLLVPTLVTKENLDSTVIKDGFQSREAVYGTTTP